MRKYPTLPHLKLRLNKAKKSGVLNLSSLEGNLNSPKYPNLDSNLNQIVQQVETGQFTAHAAAANTHLHRDETIAVTVYVVEGYVEDIVEYLKDNDASPRNIGGDYIEAYVPVSLLAEASEQGGVISIRTIVPAQPAQGTVVSGSVTVHGATAWHSAGYKGQGVKVGVIDIGSGGFSGFSSLMGLELPASVEARCYTDIGQFSFNLSDCETGDEGHGTAVTEAVFDIAPDATYYIANPITPGDLATAVDWMIEHDVDVINHSVLWLWDGPGDGTSPYDGTIPHPVDFEAPYWNSPLRTVNTAVEGGAIWINSAGNSATQTWYGDFADTDGDGFHNFNGDLECNELEVEVLLSFITVQLRWNDTWGGATRDVDLQLYEVLSSGELERVDSFFLIGGEDYQTGAAGHAPLEILEYLLAPSGTYCLAVKSITGAAPGWIQLQIFSEQELLHYTSGGSILNPAESANAGMLAVGAAHVGDTSTIEQFSSQGPTPDDRTKPDIVGADAGVQASHAEHRWRVLQHLDRTKPDIVGADGVQSAAYGDAFYGTSQAAPHVSGLAALVQQRFPTYTPQQTANYLKTHASARGAVPNNIWGHGFARLLPSDVATATPEPTPEPTVTPEPTATPEPTPEPPADSCVETISADGTVSGSWGSDCASEGRSGSYASYYTFTLTESAEVSITLESSVDTYLYLRQGAGRDGNTQHENDDHDVAEFTLASSTDSGISESLDAGDYTIEATTYDADTAGDFSLSVSGLPATAEPQPTPEPTVTIRFGDLNWSSAMLQNRIAQYIAEKGYGYSTSVESGATLPLFQRLRGGDIDVLMEVWLPNQEQSWEEALAEGAVSSPGNSLGTDWQSAFGIPKYMQDQYPDLDSVEDLKEEQYKSLFATDETDGKARLVSCVIGWACEAINVSQIEGYGLSEHVHIVNPGDGAALNADLTEAYESGEPWLGYQWGTNDPALRLDLVRLEEPAYSDECWSTTMACAYQDATILIAVNAGLSESAADFVDVLTEWDFSVEEVYKPIVRWRVENPDANTEDAAMWWLRGSNELWNEWVTEDAAASIQAALDAGEIPKAGRKSPASRQNLRRRPLTPALRRLLVPPLSMEVGAANVFL